MAYYNQRIFTVRAVHPCDKELTTQPENDCQAAEPFPGSPVVNVSCSVTTAVWHLTVLRYMEATIQKETVALIKTADAVLPTWLVEGKSEDNYFMLLLSLIKSLCRTSACPVTATLIRLAFIFWLETPKGVCRMHLFFLISLQAALGLHWLMGSSQNSSAYGVKKINNCASSYIY